MIQYGASWFIYSKLAVWEQEDNSFISEGWYTPLTELFPFMLEWSQKRQMQNCRFSPLRVRILVKSASLICH